MLASHSKPVTYHLINSVLEYSYELDCNGLNTKYCQLKPNEALLSGLGIVDRDQRKAEWWKLEKRLIDSMREAADKCYKNNLFTLAKKENYFVSGLTGSINL